MAYETIIKNPEEKSHANFQEQVVGLGAFNLRSEYDQFLNTRKDKINICFEALDCHQNTEIENRIALRCILKNWPDDKSAVKDLTYKELIMESCRFANILNTLGLKKGDKVFTLLPKIPQLYISALGTLRFGGIFSPLFSAFGPEPLQTRIEIAHAEVLISMSSFYRKKIEPIRSALTFLKFVILIDDDGKVSEHPNTLNFQELMNEAKSDYFLAETSANDPALIHFTSGTTGKPKGAVHVHGAIFYHKISGLWALDLKPNDIFWCTADPGWVTGTSYGILSPLANGVTLLIDQAEFDSQRWYQILQEFEVNVWYTAPTAIRMLMHSGADLPKNYNLKSVRLAASVGEPLNPEVVIWAKKNLGLTLHDNWWQTETGGIMISNFPSMDVKPGSMGKPMPGIEIALIERKNNNDLKFIDNPNEQAEIAIKVGWPSMFNTYLGEETRYQKCFAHGWYFSGDLAYRDADGYFWFVGRVDDVIKSSGHLIGPFEVESALMEHQAVLEAAVIGKPDPLAGEIVKAFIALKPEYNPSEDLKLSVLGFARKRLGIAVAPKEISFIETLPKTRSGKIMRRLLKAKELGLAFGDTSTLEASP